MSRTRFKVNLHHSCWNVKELFAQSRRDIGSLSESNEIRSHNHLVQKQTLNDLAKLIWLTGWVFVDKLSRCEFGSCCSHMFQCNNKIISLIIIIILSLLTFIIWSLGGIVVGAGGVTVS